MSAGNLLLVSSLLTGSRHPGSDIAHPLQQQPGVVDTPKQGSSVAGGRASSCIDLHAAVYCMKHASNATCGQTGA